MTTPSTERKAGPLLGTGAQTTWPFTFKVFAATDIAVTIADSLGVETALTYGVHYTVSLNANQETSPGGTVTYPISGSPLPTGSRLVIVGNLPYDQPLDLPAGGNFSPLAIENQLDRLTMQIQQLRENVGRAIQVSVTTGANVGLPAPTANQLIGWDASGGNLQNVPLADIATALAFATYRYDTFTGDGVETQFTLAANPAVIGNLDVAVGGVTQTPGTDYTLASGVLVFSSAPPLGATILARYGEGLSPGAVGGANDISYSPAGVGAVTRTVENRLREKISATDFGAVGDGSDETSKVQLALNALPIDGGEIHIPAGVKFNLRSLTFPAKGNLIYRADDDLSSPGQASDIGSGEWVNFSANSSYPADPTGAAVNEWRFTAPFHPGMAVDVRKDVTGANAGLRPGQSLTEPVRASYNIMDEQTGVARLVYENYASGSNFSMLQLHAWRNVVTLNGIGTGQWASVPAEGTVVTGVTSGAKGFVLSVSASSTTLLWFSGKFVAGETVSDNNETTTATVTSVSFSETAMSPLAQGLKRGNWAVGLPADAVRDMFVVGGKIGSQRTRGGPFYEDESVLHPGFVWVDSYENATPNGFEVVYDTTGAAASRRLTLRRYNSSTDIGHVGAIAAHATLTDGAGTPAIRAGAFNIASIVRGGSVGRYDVTFSNALTTANFRIVSSAQFNGFITWDLKATTGFSLFVANASGVAQWAPSDFEIVVVGGDT